MFKQIGRKIRNLFSRAIDEESLEQLERIFYEADLGAEVASSLTEQVKALHKAQPGLSSEALLEAIQSTLVSSLDRPPPPTLSSPHVIFVIGANGNGKTTSVAKLAHYYQKQGKKVLIGAADTFRAAALEQLEKWAGQIGCDLVRGKQGSDPSAVVYDTLQAATHRGADVVIIDTAGRLHTKTDLMQELAKMRRAGGKVLPSAPHETLLVLDATVGQNGVEQAKTFHTFTPLSGLILSKVDGSAKGGTAIAIQKKLQIPIQFLGTGEKLDALVPFDPKTFVKSLFS